MIAAICSEDNGLKAGLSEGHINVAFGQSRPFVASEVYEMALSLHRQGRLAEAEKLYRAVLNAAPDHPASLHHLGVIKAQQGDVKEAIRWMRASVEKEPLSAEAHNDFGVVLERAKRLVDAVTSYEQALKLKPDYPEACFNLGNALQALGRHDQAIARYEKAIALKPDNVEVLSNLGVSLHAVDRTEEAIGRFLAALSRMPSYVEALYNLGTALLKLERYDEAIGHLESALAGKPNHCEAHNNLGTALLKVGRTSEAVAHCQAAVAIKPDYAEAHNNLGNAWQLENRLQDAVACYQRALAAKPDYGDALSNLGLALKAMGLNQRAVENCKKAAALEPKNSKIHSNLGVTQESAGNLKAAAASHRRAVELDPLADESILAITTLNRRMCDWSNFSSDESSLAAALDRGARKVEPLVAFVSPDDPALQLRCAMRFAMDCIRSKSNVKRSGGIHAHGKPRIAYLCAHFRVHATSILMAELGELHDRSRFEIYGVSIGPDDGSALRKRVERSFDRFLDVQQSSDADVARQIRDLEVDLLVDLTGYHKDNRVGILAHRPAPIQVNYLAYPGTMGASFVDYVIADPFVIPADQQGFFSERVVYLPDSYQANDRKRQIADRAPTRSELKLPEHRFVFACFNNLYKITPPLFDIWMRLLREVPHSVLWLLGDNEWGIANLRQEAQARGIEPDRLIFAPRCTPQDHLARQQSADLFLDTLPCNAHATASDALWAGLPVLTCAGRSFSARVAGSLLHAIGLPELVTGSLEEYETLALKLAREPDSLGALRARLAANRWTAPLFDSARYCRNLERAYHEMHEIWRRGEAPRSFAVPGAAELGPTAG